MTGRRRTWVMLLIAVAALVVAGCGDDDGGAAGSDSDSDGAGSSETTEASDSADGDDSGASATDVDIDVPLAPGADAVSTTEAGTATVVQFIVPLDEQESTIAFYDDWTSDQSDEYQRIEAEAGGISWQNAPDAGSDAAIIAVLAPLEGDDFVTVTITVGSLE